MYVEENEKQQAKMTAFCVLSLRVGTEMFKKLA
jgi:hypothetical protein